MKGDMTTPCQIWYDRNSLNTETYTSPPRWFSTGAKFNSPRQAERVAHKHATSYGHRWVILPVGTEPYPQG